MADPFLTEPTLLDMSNVEVKVEIIEISDEEVNFNKDEDETKCGKNNKEEVEIDKNDFGEKNNSRRKNPIDPNKAAQCDVCAKMFGDKHQLRKHMITHTGEKPFVCESCGNSFRYRHSLKQHEFIHKEKGKDYNQSQCDVCGRTFVYPHQLRKHKETDAYRKFVCQECGASFFRQYTLQQHIKIHTGEKKFLCHLCDKAFVQKVNLLQHIKAHRGEKKFECEECHKKFITRSKMNQHYKKHVKKKLKEQNASVTVQKVSKKRVPRKKVSVNDYSEDECPSRMSTSPLWGSTTDVIAESEVSMQDSESILS